MCLVSEADCKHYNLHSGHCEMGPMKTEYISQNTILTQFPLRIGSKTLWIPKSEDIQVAYVTCCRICI